MNPPSSQQSDTDGIAYIGLFASIGQESVQECIDALITRLPEDTHTVYFLLSTGGGSVSYGFTLYNFLTQLPYKLVMHNVGSVDSIGGVIFLAGKERYSTENGTFLIHRVKGDFKESTANDSNLREKLSCVQTEETKIRRVLTGRSALSDKEFDQLFEYGELKDTAFALEKEWIHAVKPAPFPKPDRWVLIKGASK